MMKKIYFLIAMVFCSVWVFTSSAANPLYGLGDASGNGFVVFQGTGQPVTGLTTGTPYFYKIFTRNGSTWNAGVEVSATPAIVTAPTDDFRSVAPGGNWGDITTWETSPDNGITPWIPATTAPDATANTITIRNGANVTVAAAAGGDQITVEAGATLTFNANFTLANGAGFDLIVNGTVVNTSGTITYTGTAQFNASSLYQHNRNSGGIPTGTWNVTSTIEVTGATSAAPTNLTQTLGNFTWNSNTTTATNLIGTLTTVAGNFRVQNSGTTELSLTANTDLNLTVGGNFIIEDDLNIDTHASGISNISIGGDFSHTGGVFQSLTDLVIITLSGIGKTFTQSGGTFTPANLNWIVGAGASITLNNSLPTAAARTVTVNGTLDCKTLSVTGAGAVTASFGGRVKLGSVNVAGAVPDNISASGGLTLNTGSTVEYNGLGVQYVAQKTYSNLEINNANGITLIGDVLVTNVLGLTSGLITTTLPNLLTMSIGASYTGGNSNASFINGPMRKVGNSAFIFPVGKTGIGVIPIGISTFIGITDPSSDAFTAEYIRINPGTLGPMSPLVAAVIDHISRCDYWMLDRSKGDAIVDVTGYWNANNLSCGPYVTDRDAVEMVRFDGTEWSSSSWGLSFHNGSNAVGNVTWTGGVPAYGPIALASSNSLNPLPITINYFNGTKQNNNHLLNWKVTCTGSPNVTIDLQRSSDGQNYNSIYSIFATALRCLQPFDHTDNQPVKGINYYRLKMTDATGKVTYSSIVPLINASKGLEIMNIAPNPIVNKSFNLRISAAEKMQMAMVIIDMQGRVLQQQNINLVAGFNTIPVSVHNLAAGTYQLIGNTPEGKTRVLRFVIQ